MRVPHDKQKIQGKEKQDLENQFRKSMKDIKELMKQPYAEQIKEFDEKFFVNKEELPKDDYFSVDVKPLKFRRFIREILQQRDKEIATDILSLLDHLEMHQSEDLKTDNWRNWKYIRNSIVDKYKIPTQVGVDK